MGLQVGGSVSGGSGTNGLNGWTPQLAIVSDGERRVHRVVDWAGGGGTKPATGLYVGATGFVVSIVDAVDIRGASGAVGSGSGGSSYTNLADVTPANAATVLVDVAATPEFRKKITVNNDFTLNLDGDAGTSGGLDLIAQGVVEFVVNSASSVTLGAAFSGSSLALSEGSEYVIEKVNGELASITRLLSAAGGAGDYVAPRQALANHDVLNGERYNLITGSSVLTIDNANFPVGSTLELYDAASVISGGQIITLKIENEASTLDVPSGATLSPTRAEDGYAEFDIDVSTFGGRSSKFTELIFTRIATNGYTLNPFTPPQLFREFDIRNYGVWNDTDALASTATLKAAYDAAVSAGGGVILLPPSSATVTALEATRVAVDEGTSLIMTHDDASIVIKGFEGLSRIKTASNKIEVFAKNGNFDFVVEGVIFDNSANGILQKQVKQSTKSLNGGIAGLGNGTNCVVRQYDGTGLVSLKGVSFLEFNTAQDHLGENLDDTVLKGDVVLENVTYDGCAFGLLTQQPRSIYRNNIKSFNNVDNLNGNNTDGTETDATTVSTDPGHTLYVSNRPDAQIEHQTHSNIHASDASSSPEKIRKGQNVAISNYTFIRTQRGLEIFNNHRATISNVNGQLAAGDSNASALELTDAGHVSVSNSVFDLDGQNAWGVRVRSENVGDSITGVTQANPAVVTVSSISVKNGEKVSFYDIGGMTELEGVEATVSNRSGDTFEIDVDTTGFSAFTSGGVVVNQPYPNRHNMLKDITVIQNHAYGNGKSAFFIEGQSDCVLDGLVLINQSQNASRAPIDLRNCKRVKVLMPRHIAPNGAASADRLVVLDSDCVDCEIVYTDDCLSVPWTADTVIDNGTGTIIRRNGLVHGAITPTLTFDTAGDLAVTYGANNEGYYTDDGEWVEISIVLHVASITHTTASGGLKIGGLPVAAGGSLIRNSLALGNMRKITFSSSVLLGAFVGQGDDFILLRTTGSGGNGGTLTEANLPTGETDVYIEISGRYRKVG